jgi:Bacterial Ig-like domain
MSASSFVLAIIASLIGQPGLPTGSPLPAYQYVKERAVKLDLVFDAAHRSEIKDILLFVSQDEGSSWSLSSKAGPNDREITFSVPVDGIYWLRLVTVDGFGKQTPESPKSAPPNARVVVDTLKPYLKLTNAQRSGNEISVAWQVSEDNPNWESFRLEYLSAGSGFPIAVPTATPGISGQARFTPSTNGPITVRLTLRDKAGNESMTSAEVAGADGTVATASASSPVAPPPPPFSNPAPVNALPTLTPPPAEQYASPIPGVPQDQRPQFTTPPSRPFGERETRELRPASGAAPRWIVNNPTPAVREPEPIASTSYQVQGSVTQVQATMPAPPVAPAAPRKPLPPIRYVNSPLVVLEYELAKVGPSGVGSVEIFYTENDGQTWELLAKENEKRLSSLGAGRYQAELELPRDGVFGFTIVVRSNAQLKQELLTDEHKPHCPQPGDVPEIRVEVDTTGPSAEMFPPRRDMTKTNSLVLFWKAGDKNLSNNPITLEWSEHREGPWNAIANNLPNSGKHSWQLPDHLPVEVYLRLRVVDLAGNEGVATTPQPITVDLSEPEGRLTGVAVSPRR